MVNKSLCWFLGRSSIVCIFCCEGVGKGRARRISEEVQPVKSELLLLDFEILRKERLALYRCYEKRRSSRGVKRRTTTPWLWLCPFADRLFTGAFFLRSFISTRRPDLNRILVGKTEFKMRLSLIRSDLVSVWQLCGGTAGWWQIRSDVEVDEMLKFCDPSTLSKFSEEF